MSIKFKCKCGRLLQADDQYAGTKIPCWSCGQNVLVPRASEDGPKKSGPAPVAKWSADLPPEGIIEPGGETIKFACPCGKHIRAGVAQIGKRVGCPRCRKAVVVPSGQKKPKPEVAQDAGERKPGLGDLALDSSLDIEFESEEDAKATKVIPRVKPPAPKVEDAPVRASEPALKKPPKTEESDIYGLAEEPKHQRPAPPPAKAPLPEGTTAWAEGVDEDASDAVALKDDSSYDVDAAKPPSAKAPAAPAEAPAKPAAVASAAQPQATETCPYCQGPLPSGAIVCTKCGRYVRTGALVRVAEEVADADGVAQEGIRRGNLTQFFNTASPIDAAKAGMMNVLNGVVLYVPYALLVAISFQGLMLFQHVAAGNEQALLGSRLVSLVLTVFLWTGFVGCIRDGVFQRFFGLERFFYYAATQFPRFLVGSLLTTPVMVGLGLGLVSVWAAIALMPVGFLVKLLLWVLVGLVFLTAFMVCSYVPMLTVLEGIGPVQALTRTGAFALSHSYKLLILMAVAAGAGAASVAILRFLFMVANPILSLTLPPAIYETVKVLVSAFLAAAVWGVVTAAAMLYYLAHIGDESRLTKIQAVAKGPQANPLWVRISIPVLLAVSVALGFWQQNLGVSVAANQDIAALLRSFKGMAKSEEMEVAFESHDWEDYEPAELPESCRGWKTYSNRAWGFRMSHPAAWHVDYEVFTPREGGEPQSRDAKPKAKLTDYGVRVAGAGTPTGGGFKLLDSREAEIIEVAFKPQEKAEGQDSPRGPSIQRKREVTEDELAEAAITDTYNVCGEYTLTVRAIKMPKDARTRYHLSLALESFVFELEAKGGE